MKIYRIFFLILFFVIITLPICFINLKPDQISEIDNSKLPEKSTIKNVTSLENYLSKRLGFRKDIINFYTKANDVLFEKMVHPMYTYGEVDHVFLKINAEIKDDEYLDTFAELVKNMQEYTTQRGSYFLFVLNPTKVSVYSEYLPKGYNFTNYRINYLKNKLDELGVNYIDNTDILKELSKDTQVFNKKYDAGHWNDIGAFYGINNIYKKMQNDGIKISQLDINDYEVQYVNKNTLTESEFEIDEEVPEYTLKVVNYDTDVQYNNFLELSDKYTYYEKRNTRMTDNNLDLLFFRGSYMNNKEKFVGNQFKKSYFIHNYENSINFDYYYNIAKPDIVLFETVEYAIKEVFFPIESIKNKKYSENYEKYANLKESIIIEEKMTGIRKSINDNHNSNITLTKINLTKNNFEFAYLKVDGKVYDFCHEMSECYITLDTKLLYNKKVDIILVSKDLKSKQTIRI